MSETLVLALVVLGFLGFALVLLAALSALPVTAAKARELWPVMISEIVIVAAALALVVPGGVATGIGVVVLAARCAWEAATVVLGAGPSGRASALGLGGAAGVAALLAYFGGASGALAGVALVAIGLAGAARISRREAPGEAAILLAFPLFPLVTFAAVAARPGGGAILLLAFLLVETMDSAAVLGGRLFGRHKAFPRLSPRKTVEGLLAGALAVTLAAVVLGIGVMGWSVGRIAVVGITVAVATVAGDLVASWIKRRAGVKDYPPIHAVQGGVLDIVDAWIVAAPVLAAVSAIV